MSDSSPRAPRRRASGSGFPPAPGASHASGIDWFAGWHALREKWWLFLLCLALGLGGAAAYLAVKPKIFTATSIIRVEIQGQQVVNVKDVLPDDFRSAEALKTVEQALGSRSLAQRVARSQALADDPTFGDRRHGGKMSESQIVDLLADRSEFKLRKGSRLIDISVDDTDPARAQRLADAFVEEYVRQDFDQREQITGSASGYLVKESERLRAKLKESEQALQDYREKSGAVSLEDRQNIVAEKLKDLNRNVTQAKSARIKIEADYKAVLAAKDRPYQELLSLPTIAALPEVAELQTQINTREAEFAVLKERYLEQHPKYLQAEGQLRELRQALARAVTKAGDNLRKLLEAAVENETRLSTALREQEQAALELSKTAIPYNVLSREMEADRTLFESVLARHKEMTLTQSLDKTSVRLIEPAFYPRWPSKPRPSRVLALALLASLLAPLGLSWLLDLFDGSLRSVDQAEATLDLACLAVVPESKAAKRGESLLLEKNPGTAEAEGIRSLRTSLALTRKPAAPNITLFTSALPSEGKSFLAANYAWALAEQGQRTLLIDADLRRPGVSLIFTAVKNAKGLSDFLCEEATFAATHHPVTATGLSVMPAGVRGSNPAELFASDKFARLLKTAAEHFDAIVIDSAPVNVVSDTLMLVRHVPAVCLVVQARKTTARTLARTLQLLQLADCAPAGFVLNRVPRNAGFGYYTYYGGEYSSAGVYGAPPAAVGK